MKARIDKASDNNLVAVLSNRDGTKTYTADMSSLISFGFQFAMKIKKAIEAFSRTRAYPTNGVAHQITKWGECITLTGIDVKEYDLNGAEDLDELHLIFLEWHFASGPSAQKAKFSTLRRNWTDMGNFIRYCQRTNVLPKWDWYELPRRDTHPQSENYTSTEPGELLGTQKLGVYHAGFFEKIVSTRTLAITTEEYLQETLIELKKNLDKIIEFCFLEINQIKSDYKEGEILGSKADIDILKTLTIKSHPELFKIKDDSGKIVNLLSKEHRNGFCNAIWWIKNRYNGYFTKEQTYSIYSHDLREIVGHKGASLQKYLGLITHRKLTPFITLAICLCPEINNVDPILRIKVQDHNEAGNNLFRFVTKKERAKCAKRDLIDDKLNEAILFLKERTQVYRDHDKIDPKIIDSLFIGQPSNCYAGRPLTIKSSSQAGKNFRVFLKSYPQLKDIAHTTYSMIRNTLAVIEYIENGGDWYKVALKLGHSINTSMRHYIPKEIKLLLRERKVRQHQNEMLLVAAYDKDYSLLDAVDFTSHEEVELFLSKIMKIDIGKTDILLEVLDKKISGTDSSPITTDTDPVDTAYLPISVTGLAALFRYDECIPDNDKSLLLSKNNTTGVAPIFWKELSSKIKVLLCSESYSSFEHKAIYKKSLEKLEEIRTSMEFDI